MSGFADRYLTVRTTHPVRLLLAVAKVDNYFDTAKFSGYYLFKKMAVERVGTCLGAQITMPRTSHVRIVRGRLHIIMCPW